MQVLNSMVYMSVWALVASSCGNGIEQSRTEEVMINGNCGMCEKTIEAAALVEGVAMADWDRKTRKATITFDSTRTSAAAVLKRIADAGYDNEQYTASDEAYADRPECCQYQRTGLVITPPDPKAAAKHH